MSQKNHLLVVLTIVVSAMTVLPAMVAAQADMAPVNDIPNPYTTLPNHQQYPVFAASWARKSIATRS